MCGHWREDHGANGKISFRLLNGGRSICVLPDHRFSVNRNASFASSWLRARAPSYALDSSLKTTTSILPMNSLLLDDSQVASILLKNLAATQLAPEIISVPSVFFDRLSERISAFASLVQRKRNAVATQSTQLDKPANKSSCRPNRRGLLTWSNYNALRRHHWIRIHAPKPRNNNVFSCCPGYKKRAQNVNRFGWYMTDRLIINNLPPGFRFTIVNHDGNGL